MSFGLEKNKCNAKTIASLRCSPDRKFVGFDVETTTTEKSNNRKKPQDLVNKEKL